MSEKFDWVDLQNIRELKDSMPKNTKAINNLAVQIADENIVAALRIDKSKNYGIFSDEQTKAILESIKNHYFEQNQQLKRIR